MRRAIRWAAVAGALALGGLFAAGSQLREAPAPVWREVAWPFRNDPWGKGKAYECSARDCGSRVTLYVRPKLGLCGCMSSIEDEDLDRLGDLDLIARGRLPAGEGAPVEVRWMKGRARGYRLEGMGNAKSAIVVAFHDRCDLVVATAAVDGNEPLEKHLRPVREWLNGDAVVGWLEVKLGL